MRRHPIRRFFRHLFRTAWWQPNKESRKMLRKEADELIGWDKESNPVWVKTWKYFIKRQYPWYGIIELNQFKIIEMRDYMTHYGWLAEEETAKQVREMSEVIELGKKILADEYSKDSYKWLEENTVSVTLVYKDNLKDENLVAKLYNTSIFDDIAEKSNFNEFKLSDEAIQQLTNYIKGKDTRSLKKWLKDNNLTQKQVLTAYTSEYTNDLSRKENQDIFHKMCMAEGKARQKDIKKYFGLIAKYYDSWGD